MAHFAEFIQRKDPTGHTEDTHWVVERVVVVGNEHAPVDEGPEGENWCSTCIWIFSLYKFSEMCHFVFLLIFVLFIILILQSTIKSMFLLL